jgi:predicted nucleic acid-binding Zn ribbon protein
MSPSAQTWLSTERQNEARKNMGNIFYIIGVVVVVLFVLGYFGFR